MATRMASRSRDIGRSIADFPTWKLEDAKPRFSELVRRARTEGPQRVTCRGQDAVVVIATENLADLLEPPRTGADLIRFLQATGLGDLVLEREEDRGGTSSFERLAPRYQRRQRTHAPRG